MKASEMTNEMLAHNLEATVPFLMKEARHLTDADEILCEAAARLRKVDDYAEMCADAMREVAALRAKLKVAEDALAPWPSLAEWLVVNSTQLGISDMVAKLRERVEGTKNALAAIREEGGAK